MKHAQYRSVSSSAYHKKDGTNVRAILKEEARKVVAECDRWDEEHTS